MRNVIFLVVVCVTVAVISENQVPFPTDCGRFLNYKVFRGNKTEPDDYPWLVLLEYKNTSSQSIACGGVILSSRYVLTAAHCVATQNWAVESVRIGEYDTSTTIDCVEDGGTQNDSITCMPSARSIRVDKYIAHEMYKLDKPGFDLALLRLAEDIVFDTYVQPICFPNNLIPLAQRFHVAGWGVLSERPMNSVKLRSYVSLINQTWCTNAYAERKVFINRDQICLGGGHGEHVCFADSGGPLMGIEMSEDGSHRMAVYGVFTHYSTFCDADGWPGIFTNVTLYKDWIFHHIQQG